jgi:PAS domain S-box-containing protein
MSDVSLPSALTVAPVTFDVDTAAWFFAESLDLFLITDQSASIVQANPAWLSTTGWTHDQLVGRHLYDFIHADDVAALREAGARVRAEGSAQGVYRFKTSEGDWCWLSGRSQLASGGRLMATLRDVTEDRVRAAEIEQLRQAQTQVADTAGVSAWILDPVTLKFRYPYRQSRQDVHTPIVLNDLATLETQVLAEDWPMVKAVIDDVIHNGGVGEFIAQFAMPTGKILHLQVNYRGERHPSGLFMLHAMSRDVTEVVEARDAALRGKRMISKMIEAAPFAAAMLDRQLKHLVVSDAWRTLLGNGEQNFVGRTLEDVFPTARRRFVTAQKRALAGETVRRSEDRLIRHGGAVHWVRWEMQPWYDGDGQVGGVLAYISDVSALVAARHEAQANARRLKLAVNAAKAAVFEIDYLDESFWSGADFIALAGCQLTFDESIGVWPNVHPDDVEQVKAIWSSLETPNPIPMECRLIQPDGSARWIGAHLEIQHDALGRPRKIVGLLLDIDARKRQELALANAERQATVATEAKSRFLANISHEIRTPMNGVLGVLQLIKRAGLDAEDAKLLDEGLASGRMLTELLDDLLDFSKIETGQFELHPELLDPAQVLVGITSLLEPAASAKGLTMRAVAEPDLGMISADPLRLRQALYNIMGNAVKFTPSGSVEARLTRCDTPDGPKLRFEVQDTGIGVSEAAQATLFERFEQADGSMSRKYGGSGLGLAITKRLAEKMGGAVGFSSHPGLGSTFWLEIDGEKVDAPLEIEQDADVGEFRVLLVEDNPTNRLVISKLLQALGIVVETADDGEAGVAAAARGGFDMVLMDIQMPGMDGMEATRRIRAMDGPISATPVVAITANVMADQKSSYAAAGMDGVVSKPVSAAALLSEITRVTELRAA